VPDLAERRDDVELGFPLVDLFFGVAFERVGRHEVGIEQDENAERAGGAATLHSGSHDRRVYSDCTVLTASSTAKSTRRRRSLPATCRRNSRQRRIMSVRTCSSVNWYSPVQRATSVRISARLRRRNDDAISRFRCCGALENSSRSSRS